MPVRFSNAWPWTFGLRRGTKVWAAAALLDSSQAPVHATNIAEFSMEWIGIRPVPPEVRRLKADTPLDKRTEPLER